MSSHLSIILTSSSPLLLTSSPHSHPLSPHLFSFVLSPRPCSLPSSRPHSLVPSLPLGALSRPVLSVLRPLTLAIIAILFLVFILPLSRPQRPPFRLSLLHPPPSLPANLSPPPHPPTSFMYRSPRHTADAAATNVAPTAPSTQPPAPTCSPEVSRRGSCPRRLARCDGQ